MQSDPSRIDPKYFLPILSLDRILLELESRWRFFVAHVDAQWASANLLEPITLGWVRWVHPWLLCTCSRNRPNWYLNEILWSGALISISCNRLDDVDSFPNMLIHKASRAFKIQTFGRQSSWSKRASYLYGNCMHQINRPNDHSLGPDTRSLNMEIACSWSATVRMTGQHHSNSAQIKEFQGNFGKPIAQLSVQMPYDDRLNDT
jgi:hypothetical protein